MTCASCPKSDVELNGVSPDPKGEQAPARPTLRGVRGRVVFPVERLFLDLEGSVIRMIEPGGRVRRCVALFRLLHDERPHPSLYRNPHQPFGNRTIPA